MLKSLQTPSKRLSDWRFNRHHFESWTNATGGRRISWFEKTKRFDFRNQRKSILNPKDVVYMGSHFPLKCLDECNSYLVADSVAKLHHYRNKCEENMCEVGTVYSF